jgi:hypothetical protein
MSTRNNRTRKITLALLLASLAMLLPMSPILAAASAGTGQPNQSCQAVGVTPGNTASAPGSAFNTAGVAGTVYAGQQPQNSVNPHSVSQYDVACFQVSQH